MKVWRGIAGVIALGFVAAGVTPAWACACGGYLPDAESRARAYGEQALVRQSAGTEEITLSMAINGSSKKAAWIMPTPAPAKVELGDARLFSRLDAITLPTVVRRTTYWPFRGLDLFRNDGSSAGAPPGGVSVHEQMTLGPFQIARLSGGPAGVTGWLGTNGYVVPDSLAANLTPYLSEGWEIVAVKLAPRQTGANLAGETPPLRLSFKSDKLVYPMRLSKGATTPQKVTVYVAAEHRVDASTLPVAGVQPELLYAGRADDAALPAPANYLTAYRVSYPEPSRITSDFTFTQAATDEPYQRVRYLTHNEGGWSTIGVLVLVVLAVGGFVLYRRRSRLQHRAG